jgi:hypothetical protein
MKGVTVVIIEHPEDTIHLEDVANRSLTLRQLSGALKGASIGALGDRRTTVRVAQGEDTTVIDDMPMTAATGTVTLNNVGGTAASGTVTLGGGAGNVTIVTDGTSVGPVAFNTSDAQTATDCITALNANSTFAAKATATSGGSGVVTITWDTKGTVGNTKTLTASRSAGTATASGATLTGGAQGSVVVTVGGNPATADTTNLDNTAAAAAVAAAVNADADTAELVTATSALAVVTLTAPLNDGAAGNRTLASTSATGTATRSAATLTGGVTGAGTFLERT